MYVDVTNANINSLPLKRIQRCTTESHTGCRRCLCRRRDHCRRRRLRLRFRHRRPRQLHRPSPSLPTPPIVSTHKDTRRKKMNKNESREKRNGKIVEGGATVVLSESSYRSTMKASSSNRKKYINRFLSIRYTLHQPSTYPKNTHP